MAMTKEDVPANQEAAEGPVLAVSGYSQLANFHRMNGSFALRSGTSTPIITNSGSQPETALTGISGS